MDSLFLQHYLLLISFGSKPQLKSVKWSHLFGLCQFLSILPLTLNLGSLLMAHFLVFQLPMSHSAQLSLLPFPPLSSLAGLHLAECQAVAWIILLTFKYKSMINLRLLNALL